jgi:hypothetical protein
MIGIIKNVRKRCNICDCFSHKCETCENTIEWHIGDFKFPREDFQLWCKDCIDKAPLDSLLYIPYDIREDIICAAVGPELWISDDFPNDNMPNVDAELVVMTKRLYMDLFY